MIRRIAGAVFIACDVVLTGAVFLLWSTVMFVGAMTCMAWVLETWR